MSEKPKNTNYREITPATVSSAVQLIASLAVPGALTALLINERHAGEDISIFYETDLLTSFPPLIRFTFIDREELARVGINFTDTNISIDEELMQRAFEADFNETYVVVNGFLVEVNNTLITFLASAERRGLDVEQVAITLGLEGEDWYQELKIRGLNGLRNDGASNADFSHLLGETDAVMEHLIYLQNTSADTYFSDLALKTQLIDSAIFLLWTIVIISAAVFKYNHPATKERRRLRSQMRTGTKVNEIATNQSRLLDNTPAENEAGDMGDDELTLGSYND